MTSIDESARVASGAVIGTDVTIGPFCVIGPDVVIGDGCRLIAQRARDRPHHHRRRAP